MRVRRLVPLALLVAFALVPIAALAEGPGLPDSVDVNLRPGNTTYLGLQTTFGFLDADDGRNFTWICHETMAPTNSVVTPIFWVASDGTFLASLRAIGVGNDPTVSFYRSTDGCQWDPVPAFDGLVVRAADWDPNDSRHAIAITSTASQNNGAWLTSDGGLTWVKTSLDVPNEFFRSVRYDRYDPRWIYATSDYFSPAGAWVYVSSDGGLSWRQSVFGFAPGGTPQVAVEVAAISPADPQRVYVRTDGATDYLLLSTNGGTSFDVAFVSSGSIDITKTAFDRDGSLWIGRNNATPFRAAHEGDPFVPIAASPPPSIRGMASDPRGMFVAANDFADGFGLGESSNGGVSFVPRLHFKDIVGPRSCPAGSTVETTCVPLWPSYEILIGITTTTPTPNPAGGGGGGCKCDVAGDGAGAAIAGCLLAAATLLAARRRRA